MRIATGLGSPAERATRMFFTRVMLSLARTLQDESLTVAQIGATFLVDERGFARVTDLADELGLSQSAASRMADGLVERGLLTRSEDASDRRARLLTLTPAGRKFVERLSVERMRLVESVAASLPGTVAERFAGAFTRLGEALGRTRRSSKKEGGSSR